MGFIKEPKGIDLIVKSEPLTEQDKKLISSIIAQYKLTGKKPSKIRKSPQLAQVCSKAVSVAYLC